jgi:3-hydroxybutyryl-CoA dehydratase
MDNGRVLTSVSDYFEDFSIGDRFETRAVTMTEAAIVIFSGLSGDHHPMHTDESYAAGELYGTRVAQGLLTLSMSTGLIPTPSGPDDNHVLAFYGMDRVRFLGPVKIGDSIHIEGEVIALDRKDDNRGIVTFRHHIKNQRGELVAVLEKKTLHKTRSSSD